MGPVEPLVVDERRDGSRAGRFFVIGPLRTGTSVLSRCIDDHPEAICLCESEINRALFRDYVVAHHCQRMNAHGLTTEEALGYLDRRPQEDVASFAGWYDAVRPRLAEIYDKPGATILGDKSPDLYRSRTLVAHLAANHRLIYTIRDPRAIFSSIYAQTDASPDEKAERWVSLFDNYRSWEPYLDRPNVLVIRYEDLIRTPRRTMGRVYAHLGLPDSSRFLTPFARIHPYRFLWRTAVDWETGINKDFDLGRISSWTSRLGPNLLRLIEADAGVAALMERFGYEARAEAIGHGRASA